MSLERAYFLMLLQLIYTMGAQKLLVKKLDFANIFMFLSFIIIVCGKKNCNVLIVHNFL